MTQRPKSQITIGKSKYENMGSRFSILKELLHGLPNLLSLLVF